MTLHARDELLANRFRDLEYAIADLADMGEVLRIMLDFHQDQAKSIAGMGLSGKSAIEQLQHSQKPLDFIVLQLAGLACQLRAKYYADHEAA